MKYNLQVFEDFDTFMKDSGGDVYLLTTRDFSLWYHYKSNEGVTNCYCTRHQEDGSWMPSVNESYAKIASILGNPQLREQKLSEHIRLAWEAANS